MKYFLYIISLFFFVSCVEEQENTAKMGRTIQLSITSYTGAISRIPGVDDLNENVISNVYVFFYDEEGIECLYYPPISNISISSTVINVDIPETADKILDRPLNVYVLANCNRLYSDLSGKSLLELQNLVQENPVSFNSENVFTKQANFLMDGKLTGVVIPSIGEANLPLLELRRAAAKIVVNITSTSVDNYEAMSARVRLSKYLDKTSLGEDAPFYIAQPDEYKTSPYRSINLSPDPDQTNNIFYSYANDWEYGPSLESYVTLAIVWRNINTPTEKEYYYRIPFNYVPDDPDDEKKFRLRRNHIYGFNIDISELGGIDPEQTVEIAPHFTIRDWLNESVIIELNVYEYLVVNERYIEIFDVKEREIQYVSSKEAYLEEIKTWYNQYEASGEIIPTTIDNPQINMDDTSIKVTFEDIPDNYVPRNLEFTVKNEAGLSQKVTLVQYPPIYITSELSVGSVGTDIGPSESGGNHNLYTITITKTSTGDPYVIGNPTEYISNKFRTIPAEHSKNLVSPKFVVASQRLESVVGPTTAQLWDKAVERCQTFYEDPYPKGTWRLPTYSELQLMYTLHFDSKSALKKVFTGGGYGVDAHRYWTATEHWDGWEYVHYGKDMNDENPRFFTYPPSTTSKTRCIYDVWRTK